MKYNTARPYAATYAILRKGDKVAFVMRSNTRWMNGYYSLPAGKVENGEAFSAAAIREAKEEAGVDIKPEHLKPIMTMHRNELGGDGLVFVDVFFEATEWSGEPYNAEPKSHSELTWLDIKNLPENVITSLRFALDRIAEGKIYSEYGWDVSEANNRIA